MNKNLPITDTEVVSSTTDLKGAITSINQDMENVNQLVTHIEDEGLIKARLAVMNHLKSAMSYI